jgi:hypothetical protein
VLTLVVSIPLAWVGYSLRWIKERHDWRDNPAHVGFTLMYENADGSDTPVTAPGGLWVFGEEGFGKVWCRQSQLETVRRLFPEAVVNPDDPPNPLAER